MLDTMENLDETLVPEKALDNEETRRMILELVDGLSPEQRMCVLFYYYDEMSVKDIARAMETSEGTVKSRLNYARKAIRAGVEEYERKGIKLYSVSPIVLLVYFLRQEASTCTLEGAAASAMAGQVIAQAGGAALAEGAAIGGAAGSSAVAGTAGGSAAAAAAAEGAAAAGSAAGSGAAAGVAAGISAKVAAGILAGVIAVGGATAGIASLMGRDAQEPALPPAVEAVEQQPVPAPLPEEEPDPTPTPEPDPAPSSTPEPEPTTDPEPTPEPASEPEPTAESEPEPEPEATPFAEARGLNIGSPATYSNLPALPVCDDPEVTALPSTCTISQPSVSQSAPDGEGYVTYTISYTVTTKCHLGTTKAEPESTPYTIWFESYGIYDYYTGSTYFLPYVDAAAGQTSDSASAAGEHDGKSFTVTAQASAQKLADAGSNWVESEESDYTYEIHSDLVYRMTLTVRAPGDYDGLLLGLNIVDQPSSAAGADSLASVNLSHYRFIRLG